MSLKKYKEVIPQDFAKDIDLMNESIKKLDLDKTSMILDIGTGIGVMSILLAINGFNVLTGEPKVDPESDDLDHHSQEDDHKHHHDEHFEGGWSDWKESAKAIGVENKISYQHFNAESLPFPIESFDGIFVYDALQHIQNRELALNECLRVLKPEGVISIIEWTEKTIREEYEKFGYKIDFIDPAKYLKRDDISIEVIKGEFVNIYLIRTQ